MSSHFSVKSFCLRKQFCGLIQVVEQQPQLLSLLLVQCILLARIFSHRLLNARFLSSAFNHETASMFSVLLQDLQCFLCASLYRPIVRTQSGQLFCTPAPVTDGLFFSKSVCFNGFQRCFDVNEAKKRVCGRRRQTVRGREFN